MKKLSILFCLILAVSLVMGSLVSCSGPEETTTATTQPTTTSPPEPGIIKIGVITTYTGFGASFYTALADVAELSIDWVNDNGGVTVNGRQYFFEGIMEDSQGTGDGAIAAATKLVHDDGVDFIACGIDPNFMVTGIASVTEPAGVINVHLFNNCEPEVYGPDTPYSFVSGNAAYEAFCSGTDYLVEAYPEVETAVFIQCYDGAEVILDPLYEELAAGYGITTLDIVGWAPDTVDFVPIATKAASSNPDAIGLGNGFPFAHGAIVKALYEMGYDGVVYYCSPNPLEDIIEIAGAEACEGIFSPMISDKIPDSDLPPTTVELRQMIRDELGYFHAYFAIPVNQIWEIAQAIEAAQSLDPTVVRDTWENMETIETFYGTGRMGGQETYGINHTVCHPMTLCVIRDGEVQLVKWLDVYSP